MTRPQEASAYLIVEGSRRWGAADAETGEKSVADITIVGFRKYRPKSLSRDQIAVRVTLRLPASVFDDVTPSVVIDVPEDFVIHGPVEVTATKPEG